MSMCLSWNFNFSNPLSCFILLALSYCFLAFSVCLCAIWFFIFISAEVSCCTGTFSYPLPCCIFSHSFAIRTSLFSFSCALFPLYSLFPFLSFCAMLRVFS
ncbi:hypothetical protein EDB19DRAFT_1232143 [Suillus lakei]|nr:hypothetical protein EDB19DRAFT_1232143 [Suillus lakei]